MSNKLPAALGTAGNQKRGLTSSISAPMDGQGTNVNGDDLANGRKRVGGERSSGSGAVKLEAKNNAVSKIMQKQSSLSGSTPNMTRSASMNGKTGHKSVSGKPMRPPIQKTSSAGTIKTKPQTESGSGAQHPEAETNHDRQADSETQDSGVTPTFLTVAKNLSSVGVPEAFDSDKGNRYNASYSSTASANNTEETNGTSEAEKMLNNAVPINETFAATSSAERATGGDGVSLPSSPLDQIASYGFYQVNVSGDKKIKEENGSNSKPSPRKLLSVCNENCSGLHFCLQAIPDARSLGRIVPTTAPIGTINDGIEATGDAHASTSKASEKPKVIQPEMGVLEAFNNLHSIRNLAINSGLCSLEDYRNLSAIESLLLRVFNNGS